MGTVTTTAPAVRKSFRFSRRQSIALVFCGTILGAAAQVLIKSGANLLPKAGFSAMLSNPALFGETLHAIAMNVPVITGYSLYGLFTVLLVLALRDDELSILYPVISLTYVWVTILSIVFFKETVNVFKVLGVAIVVFGVGVLGRDKRE